MDEEYLLKVIGSLYVEKYHAASVIQEQQRKLSEQEKELRKHGHNKEGQSS